MAHSARELQLLANRIRSCREWIDEIVNSSTLEGIERDSFMDTGIQEMKNAETFLRDLYARCSIDQCETEQERTE